MQKYTEAEIGKFNAEYEEYKQTEEYTKWEKKMEDREDDDIFKYDPDPVGWLVFFKASDPKNDYGLTLV